MTLASAGQFDGQGDHPSPKPYVRKAFAKYLECGIFAHGFARARCGDCGHDFLAAFFCKGRGVCPSCTTRRMARVKFRAAHLSDHVFPRLPVRQWVLSVPQQLRFLLRRDGVVLGMVLRILLHVIAQTLQANSSDAAHANKAALHIGAVAFIHRFGSSLNEHVHFHVGVVDDVFESLVVGEANEQGTRNRRGHGAATGVPTKPEPIQPVQPRRPAHILWAALIARIYEVFPLLCPICAGPMRVIAFITHSADIRHILEHIGAETEPPRIAPARWPPLWDGCDVPMGDGVKVEPDGDEAAQPAPDFEVDQRFSW